jgi:hypothetical protein
MSAAARTIVVILLFVLGVQLWLVTGRGEWGNLPGPIVWTAVLLAALLPPANRRVAAALQSIARPSPRRRLVISFVLAIAAGAYLYFTAVRQQRDFFLKIHDEHSYAIQARMLAGGRLWMPSHPAADSFDSPYVLVRPVYASMYFPGAALTLVPAVWLGMPWWVTPLVLAGASVGVLYRAVAEMLDGLAALLAALMLVALGAFRELSLRLYSQTPMLFLAVCVIWAWLAWRRDRRAWRAAIIGVIAGWMLIVRPLDAVVFLVPLAIAILLELRKPDLRTIVAIAIGIAPFLAIQLIANRGITGSLLTTPHAFYAARDFPGVTLGFHTPRPPSSLATIVPQKRVLYEEAVPAITRHRPQNLLRELFRNRLPLTVATTLPNNLLLIFVPLGVAALLTRRADPHAWLLVVPLPLYLLAYALYLFYFAHYLIVIAPAMIVLVLLGAREMAALFARVRNALTVLITCSVAALSLLALPEFHRTVYDDVGADDLPAINDMLANLRRRPAIVLFRYQPGVSIQREPVYNVDTKDIDHADVIRAHDLPGEPNGRLLEYYAARQPQRHVYRVVRKPDGAPPELIDLGPVGDVVSRTPP